MSLVLYLSICQITRIIETTVNVNAPIVFTQSVATNKERE